ncbi:MAG: hypothetical protein E7211_10240 [Clostridium lundense]|nr:hypothetical protein [Clostridium lundense]
MVLNGTLKTFPHSFWTYENSRKNAVDITKYLIEEILCWSHEDIKNKLTQKTFFSNKLCTMLLKVYGGSPFEVINSVYPNKFKPWELKHVPNSYWTLKNGIQATKWLIEEKLKWSDDDIKERLTERTFFKYGLGGMIDTIYNGSTFKTLDSAYPNKFKPWELKQVPNFYWTLENGIEATKWLIEEKLKWSDDDIKKRLSVRLFSKHRLSGMINLLYNNSAFEAINSAYPNRFKPWELNSAPKGYWSLQTGKEATKWLVEVKLNGLTDNVANTLTSQTFKRNGLGGILTTLFNDSPYEALNSAYPNKFKPWQLNNIPKHYWTLEKGIQATKWLIEEKLNLSPNCIKGNVRRNNFVENGLSGMLITCFNNSYKKALIATYLELEI